MKSVPYPVVCLDDFDEDPSYEPLFELMPEQRVRVHEGGREEIAAWLYASGAVWRGILKRTHRGLNDRQRKALRGQKAYARTALKVLDTLIDSLHDSVSRKDYDEMLMALRCTISLAFPGGPHTATEELAAQKKLKGE